jgi:hypothetical protein
MMTCIGEFYLINGFNILQKFMTLILKLCFNACELESFLIICASTLLEHNLMGAKLSGY